MKSSTNKYTIHLTSKAQKDLNKLSLPIKQRLIKKIKNLQTNRYPQQFKALIGYDIAQFRLRVGDYRILYDVYDSDQVVLIFRIGHRKDIYR